MAAAPDCGIAWVEVPAGGRSDELTLQLVDDRPITAQVIDLEGKPVPGATLQCCEIKPQTGTTSAPGSKPPRGTKDKPQARVAVSLAVHVAPAPKVTTDAEGRIRLTGIGRDRLVVAKLEGPTIVSQHLRIVTRPGEAFNVAGLVYTNRSDRQYYGAEFRHAAAPAKPIVGVIHDRDTKKPLAGVTVLSDRMA